MNPWKKKKEKKVACSEDGKHDPTVQQIFVLKSANGQLGFVRCWEGDPGVTSRLAAVTEPTDHALLIDLEATKEIQNVGYDCLVRYVSESDNTAGSTESRSGRSIIASTSASAVLLLLLLHRTTSSHPHVHRRTGARTTTANKVIPSVVSWWITRAAETRAAAATESRIIVSVAIAHRPVRRTVGPRVAVPSSSSRSTI